MARDAGCCTSRGNCYRCDVLAWREVVDVVVCSAMVVRPRRHFLRLSCSYLTVEGRKREACYPAELYLSTLVVLGFLVAKNGSVSLAKLL